MANDPLEPSVPEKLRALRERWARQLPEKVRAIEAGWNGLNEGSWDEEGAGALRIMVHDLVGTGGILGFNAVSGTAHALELILKSIIEDAVPPAGEQRERISASVEALKQASLDPGQV